VRGREGGEKRGGKGEGEKGRGSRGVRTAKSKTEIERVEGNRCRLDSIPHGSAALKTLFCRSLQALLSACLNCILYVQFVTRCWFSCPNSDVVYF